LAVIAQHQPAIKATTRHHHRARATTPPSRGRGLRRTGRPGRLPGSQVRDAA
jgi:hypothetical protein